MSPSFPPVKINKERRKRNKKGALRDWMSQRLVMNYRHSSLGQRFTPSPCHEGQRIAGSLDLEEAALRFPVPTAGSPRHGCQQQQEEHDGRELKDPKYLPALERDHPGDPYPSCCLCSIRREVSRHPVMPSMCRFQSAQRNPILACFWHGI